MREVHQSIKERFAPEEWTVTETEYNLAEKKNNETIFSLGNGYLGVRGGFEEDFSRESKNTDFEAMINGVYTYFDYNHVWERPGYPKRWHSITTQMNPFNITVYCDGEKITIESKNVKSYKRQLNLFQSVLVREMEYITAKGKTVRLLFTRFISMYDKQLSVSKLVVNTDKKAKIIIVSQLSKRCASNEREADGRANEKKFCEWQKLEEKDGIVLGTQGIKISGHEVACAFDDEFFVPATMYIEEESISKQFSFVSEPNKDYEYIRYNAHATNLSGKNYIKLAIKSVSSAKKKGFEKCLKEHSFEWEKFWDKSDIVVEGDLSIQQGVRFCLHAINSLAGRDGKTNISANGLMGIGYCGHTFWDTELFMMPMFMYTNPEIAKQLIIYRYNILDKARERAKQMDDRGALFAWNSINGEECGHVFEAASAQYHINNDVFYSIYRYYEATQDIDFLVQYGMEILFEISKCMAHRGAFIPLKGNKFCLNGVCGPDEYTPIVDNNLYTNFLTKKQFYFTLRMKDVLKEKYPDKYVELYEKCQLNEEEFALWKKAADNMYFGYNEELDIYTQDDQFHYKDPVDIEWLAKNKYPLLFNFHPLNLWRMQVCKQADIVLLMFIFGNEFDKDMRKRIYDYYEPRTIHDSSLSASIHSIVASDIGYKSDSYNYLKQACRMDLDNYNKNVAHGIHAACSGSAFMMIVNGYGGLRIYEDRLNFSPFIDSKWGKITFKLLFSGSRILVEITKEKTAYTLIEGNPITITHFDNKIQLSEINKKHELNNKLV